LTAQTTCVTKPTTITSHGPSNILCLRHPAFALHCGVHASRAGSNSDIATYPGTNTHSRPAGPPGLIYTASIAYQASTLKHLDDASLVARRHAGLRHPQHRSRRIRHRATRQLPSPTDIECAVSRRIHLHHRGLPGERLRAQSYGAMHRGMCRGTQEDWGGGQESVQGRGCGRDEHHRSLPERHRRESAVSADSSASACGFFGTTTASTTGVERKAACADERASIEFEIRGTATNYTSHLKPEIKHGVRSRAVIIEFVVSGNRGRSESDVYRRRASHQHRAAASFFDTESTECAALECRLGRWIAV
jgi:hypothetical protein